MTILTGEKYVIETRKQFENRLGFSDEDIARAVRESGEFDVVDYHNQLAEEYPEFDKITEEEIGSVDAGHYVADNVPFNMQVIATLEYSDREFVHLYDGTLHTIVHLFNKDTHQPTGESSA